MKKPNKITKIVIAALLFISTYGNAQLANFQKHTSVDFFSVDKKMFEMMGKLNPHSTQEEDVKFRNLTVKLKDLKVFTTQNKTVFNQMKTEVHQFVETHQMKTLSEAKPANQSITFYVNQSATADTIEELLMIVESENNYKVMMVEGNFALKDLALLTSKMKVNTGVNFNKFFN